MKVAVIGKGKTGQAVIDLLKDNEISDIFDSQNLVTVEKLNKADVAIVFVNAVALRSILPILLQSKVMVVCGSTGFDYTDEIIDSVNQNAQTWVVANNFSLSMVLIKQMLSTLGNLQNLVTNTSFALLETHHIEKLDAPSGTAISWQKWLSVDNCPIESIRKEDVKGEHRLVVSNPYEKIELKHTAHDRRLFAQGAIWAARFVCKNEPLIGFYQFDELVGGVL
ncbi:dihydrodipicolinate reductase C-terminal domain-containing protein [Fastidiosibacter lacustris]|uniref:dihydrodipicolinate reductase C-terminal domain-containing protein n=1 Tax=Fastidiosibacter lacustris TaxID=2056695 RepID=UPI000E34C1AA|nr:dihydrodipicolinate reductase C-terminal domain-containing protein [Fastidiosibacter lacustris]